MITVSEALYALGIDGGWKIKDGKVTKWWADKPQPSQSEIDTKIAELRAAEPMRLLRQERNHRLVETDWTQLKDIVFDLIRERNWKNYRQALRDLPSKSTPKLDSNGNLDMSSVTWPDKPSP